MQYMGLPAILSVVLAMAVCTVLGIVIEGLAYKRCVRRRRLPF